MVELETIENVVKKIKNLDGTHNFYVPDDEDKKKILEKEKQAEKNVMMGLGKGDNQAIKKIINEKDACLVFVTDKEFEWPSGPNLILKRNKEVIGKEITDKDELEELKQKDNVLVRDTLVIFKDKMKEKGFKKGKNKPTVIFPPKEFKPIKNLKGIKKPIFGSPCPPAHDYLQKKMKMNLSHEHGTALVGFDLEK